MIPPDPTTLELDAGDLQWLARLAAALIADPHGADDLVQGTLVTALRVPPPEGAGRRRWLAQVARRLAIKRHRGSSRRTRREREVELHPARTLDVVVATIGSGAPRSGLQVVAIHGADGDLVMGEPYNSFPERFGGVTDESGRARLEVPTATALWVGVALGGGQFHHQRVELEGDSFGELRIELPELATVSGTFALDDPAADGDLIVSLQSVPGIPVPEGIQRSWLMRIELGPVESELRADGSFGPLQVPPGAWNVAVYPDAGPAPLSLRARSGHLTEPQQREVAPGEQVHWNFEQALPAAGQVELELRVDGVPAPGATVRLRSADPVRHYELVLDGNGRVGSSDPAGTYTADVQLGESFGQGELLVAKACASIVVHATAPTPVEIDLATARRPLLLLEPDETSASEAGGTLRLVPIGEPHTEMGWGSTG